MRIILQNNRAKFHPYLIWNDTVLAFFKERLQHEEQEKNKTKLMNNHMGSLPGI